MLGANYGKSLCVEGSSNFIKAAKENVNATNVEFANCLFEEIGFFENTYALTESDRNHGHRRMYDDVSFVSVLAKAGFEVVDKGESFVKPFVEFQMEAMADAAFWE